MVHINDFIIEQVAREPRFFGYGTIHAGMQDLCEEVEFIMANGLRGLKMHTDCQVFPIDDPRLFPVYEMAGEKLPIVFHMGDRRYDYSHPARLRKVLDLFPKLVGVLDMIYNPARTQLLLDAEKRGLVAINGLWMLVAQAKEASEWFTGSKISNDVIEPIMDKLERQMHNIILVGMPGCGKSTVGKLLSEKTYYNIKLWGQKVTNSRFCFDHKN